MNTKLEVFEYTLESHFIKEPHLVDWEELGIENKPELVKQQYTNWSFVINNNAVTITSDVNTPAGNVHNNPIQDGSFYRFESKTTFLITDLKTDITPEVVGELVLVHLGRISLVITDYCMKVTNGKTVYAPKFFSLSKLILTASISNHFSV